MLCFTLYCCLSGPKFPPLFPWSSNAMCSNFIMYILSLVRQREEGAKKSDDSPILALRPLTIPGICGWNKESDYWHSQKVKKSAQHRYLALSRGPVFLDLSTTWFLEYWEDTSFMSVSQLQCLGRTSCPCLTRQFLPSVKIWTTKDSDFLRKTWSLMP